MAKCMKNSSGLVTRVPDDEARALAKKGWSYISKSEYKRALAEITGSGKKGGSRENR